MSDCFLQGDIRLPDEKPKDCLDSEMTSLRGTGGASLVTPAGALAVYKELCSTFVDDTVHSNLWLLDLFCPSTFILTLENAPAQPLGSSQYFPFSPGFFSQEFACPGRQNEGSFLVYVLSVMTC